MMKKCMIFGLKSVKVIRAEAKKHQADEEPKFVKGVFKFHEK